MLFCMCNFSESCFVFISTTCVCELLFKILEGCIVFVVYAVSYVSFFRKVVSFSFLQLACVSPHSNFWRAVLYVSFMLFRMCRFSESCFVFLSTTCVLIQIFNVQQSQLIWYWRNGLNFKKHGLQHCHCFSNCLNRLRLFSAG